MFKETKLSKKIFLYFGHKFALILALYATMSVMLTHWSTFTERKLKMEPQTLWAAISVFAGFLFTLAAAVWIVRKAIGDIQVEMAKAFGESQARTDKAIGESQARTDKAIGELKTDTAKSFGEVNKSFGELKADTAKSFGEVDKSFGELKGEVKGLKGQVSELKGEVHGINEFLRRKPTTEGEK